MQDAQADHTSQSDIVDVARANALDLALGRSGQFAPGDALPPFYHQIYFWSPVAPDGLGRDGHPKVGGVIPDTGLPRRMWAGGRLQFDHPFRAGVPAEKRTFLEATETKSGRSGPLAFVTLRHEIWQADACCVTEWQDLVYRNDPAPDAPKPAPPQARTDEQSSEQVAFDATLLFRYSALTFNGHRIHYDRDYARQVEGYPGLVVHGPLLAQLLMLKAMRDLGALRFFAFRATSALMDHETAELCRNGQEFWVRGPDGRQNMTAQAVPSE